MNSFGLVVNPVAGLGGRVGLKGTDGVVEEALRRGATALSPSRAVEFLKALKPAFSKEARLPRIITWKGPMGENEIKAAGLEASEVLQIPSLRTAKGTQAAGESNSPYYTTAKETKSAVRLFTARNVDLIIFVGGDGTARDVMDALSELESEGNQLSLPPVLGVPSGVKMYSGVFALSPVNAAEMVALYAEGKAEVADLEVMDIDEEAFRNDQLSIRLYGYMKCLYVPMMSQASKEVSPDVLDEKENQRAIAKTIIEKIDPDGLYILGPGTTVKTLSDLLGLKKTTLGVDLYFRGKMIALDADEETILNEINKHGGKRNTWIVVSPIGRQGIVFGRGNQQVSPKVIMKIGKDHIIIAATKTKVRDLDGGCLKVDTGENAVDNMLRGYTKVLTDYREWRMLEVR
ncbi:MAG: ATP-NAD kinase family protein [Candidatus Atabeyarchaeum deiterrae]